MRVPQSIAVLALVLTLPVLLPYALIAHQLYRRRLRRAAEAQSCPSCGGYLGIAALQASEDRWRAHVADLFRDHPGVRFRLVRLIHAVCTACGARLHFRKSFGAFVPSEATV